MGMPKAPDPYKTADAQTRINRDAATDQQLTNMVNQVDAGGNTLNYNQTGTYSYTDSNGRTITKPQFTAVQRLSAPQQAIYDQSVAAAGNMANAARRQSANIGAMFSKPIDFGVAPQIGDHATDRTRVEKALLDRMNPQLEQSRAEAEARAIAKGLRPGSVAYDSEMAGIGRNANDARLAAIAQAGQEQSRLVTQAQNLRNQSINEIMMQRNQPLNELNALLSGSQVSPQQMQMAQTPQASIAPADLQGAIERKYQADVQARGAMLGGIGGLFGSLFRMSDRRLKRDVVPLGRSRHGIPEYAFRYLWDDQIHIGPMADEVPEMARVTLPSGFMAVDYGAVL